MMTAVRFTSVAIVGAVVAGAMSLSPWSPRAVTMDGLTRASIAHAAQPTAATHLGADEVAPQEIAVRYTTTPAGSRARYRVRERLLGRELDNDAVGETTAITGTIALTSAGAIVPGASSFLVNMTGLKSDESRRDRYVQSRILETDSFPTTRLAVTGVRGLPSPVPTSGRVQFQLVGDLTLKGVTRPTTWNVTANVNGNQLTGTAATAFTFTDFNLKQPKVRVVLSVADTIRLEYDFVMAKVAQ